MKLFGKLFNREEKLEEVLKDEAVDVKMGQEITEEPKAPETVDELSEEELGRMGEGEKLNRIAEEAMRGDKASPEVSGEEKENIEEEKERE